jgi:3-methyladenine DNA glycosylase AlkC
MAELLKNIFFTPASISHLANTVKRIYPPFEESRFTSCIHSGQWDSLELKQKMRHVSTCLHESLPPDYIRAVEILEKAAPEIKGFDSMALPDFVEQYGLDHFDRSLVALAWFTRFSSSEFAIRPFLARDLKKVMDYMYRLADSQEEWVRRFSSEGCRPRLPWAQSIPELKKDPTPILPILKKLKNDPSETVRRSVANNLNDISRDHPDLVVDLCRRWMGESAETDKLIKHALRTLLKEGNTGALQLFGYAGPDQVEVISLSMENQIIPIGDSTSFEVVFNNKYPDDVKLRLEYAIYYRKSNDGLSKKVFQVAEKTYSPGIHSVRRKLSFAEMTTRKHYPGEHHLSFIINGKELKRSSFSLLRD